MLKNMNFVCQVVCNMIYKVVFVLVRWDMRML